MITNSQPIRQISLPFKEVITDGFKVKPPSERQPTQKPRKKCTA
jgi:hypothetical protein